LANLYDNTHRKFSVDLTESIHFIGRRQIYYIEDKPVRWIHDCITANLKKVETYFRFLGYEFIFIPRLIDDFTRNTDVYQFIHSRFGYLYGSEIDQLISSLYELDTSFFTQAVLTKSKIKGTPGLLIISGQHDSFLYPFKSTDANQLIKEFLSIHPDCSSRSSLSEAQEPAKSLQEYEYVHEIRENEVKYENILDEILTRTDDYKKPDIYEFLIDLLRKKKMEHIESSQLLSKLVITEDFRIFFPGFKNQEFTLSPLFKILYVLILSSPEGILLHDLHQHQALLIAWYRAISGIVDDEKMIRSINSICDPNSESATQKISKINRAIRSFIGPIYSAYYVISNEALKPKRITLPRDLIDCRIKITSASLQS